MIRGSIQKARALARRDLLDDPEVGAAVRQRLDDFAELQREKAQQMMGQ